MTRTSVRSPLFVCAGCGYESAKWLGRCTECGTWGSVVESERPTARSSSGRRAPVGSRNVPVPIAEVAAAGASLLPTDLTELDRVLGGGLVAGSVTLVGGEPGMGKSTLLMQALGRIAARGARCLLVCAEESTAQVRMRADRLGALAPELFVLSETSLPAVVAYVATVEPVVLAIDSIQAVHDPDAPGVPGSVAQVRDGVQSLVAPTGAPIPRRIAQAFEGNRLSMLVAVLQQRAGVVLGNQDVYASVAGGVRVSEPAADLAVALAIAGARNDYAVEA